MKKSSSRNNNKEKKVVNLVAERKFYFEKKSRAEIDIREQVAEVVTFSILSYERWSEPRGDEMVT